MDRLNAFLVETYVAAPGARLNVKTIFDDFRAWVIAKYGAAEWNAYGTYEVYRALRSCKDYGHKRFKEGICLIGLKYRSTPLDGKTSATPSIPLRLNIIKSLEPIVEPGPNLNSVPSSNPTQLFNPTPSSETLPTPIPSSEAISIASKPLPAPPPTTSPRRISSFQPKKVDRRHRPAPPKPKTPEVYVPGSSEMPDLDVFIRPHLYRNISPGKLPKSGPVGATLQR